MSDGENIVPSRDTGIDRSNLRTYWSISGYMEYVNLRELSGLSEIPFPTVVHDFSCLSVADVRSICKGSAENVLKFLEGYKIYKNFLESKARATVSKIEIVEALRASGLDQRDRKDFLRSRAGKWIIKRYGITIVDGK